MTVRVPATTANVGSGYDTLGLALDTWNTLTVELADRYTWNHAPWRAECTWLNVADADVDDPLCCITWLGSDHVDRFSVFIRGEGAEHLPRDETNLVVQGQHVGACTCD